ncbi:MAG: hypothetical protein ACFFDN_11675 [Candidatus Hodarchaeota archaeon]
MITEKDKFFKNESEDCLRKSIEVLYQENSLFHRYDVDWRYRIMSRLFVTIAALLYVAKWIWECNDSLIKSYLFLPIFLISILSLTFYLLDRRVVSQITVSSKVALHLEKALYKKGGHFTGLSEAGRITPGKHGNKRAIISYTFLLGFLYLFTFLSSLICAIVLFCLY